MEEKHPFSNTVFDPNTAEFAPIPKLSRPAPQPAPKPAADTEPAVAVLDRILSAVVRTADQRQEAQRKQTTSSRNFKQPPRLGLSSARPPSTSNFLPATDRKTQTFSAKIFHKNYAHFVVDSDGNEIYRDPYKFNDRERDAEIDRIYGTGDAGKSIRLRMSGTWLENPFAEEFTHLVDADIAETRTAEWLSRQALRRQHMSRRLDKDKDFIIERGNELREEMKDLKDEIRALKDEKRRAAEERKKKKPGFYGAQAVEDDKAFLEAPSPELPDDAWPTGLGAAGRSALTLDLIKRLPTELEDFQKRKGAYEKEMYGHHVTYEDQFGKGTYEPWQEENANMIRALVYEIIELIMDAYEGRENAPYSNNQPQNPTGSASQRYEESNQITSTAKGSDSKPSGVPSQNAAGPDGKVDLKKVKSNFEAKAQAIKNTSSEIKARRQAHLDNAMLEKIAHLEGDMTIMEVTKMMVLEVTDEEVELMRLCQDFTRQAAVKVAWALANPAAASRGGLPNPTQNAHLQTVYNKAVFHSFKK